MLKPCIVIVSVLGYFPLIMYNIYIKLTDKYKCNYIMKCSAYMYKV